MYVIWHGSLKLQTSSAPPGVVLSLDNTDGVIVPWLDHVAHEDHGVLIGVILQNVIILITFKVATCNYYGPACDKMFDE